MVFPHTFIPKVRYIGLSNAHILPFVAFWHLPTMGHIHKMYGTLENGEVPPYIRVSGQVHEVPWYYPGQIPGQDPGSHGTYPGSPMGLGSGP